MNKYTWEIKPTDEELVFERKACRVLSVISVVVIAACYFINDIAKLAV